MAESCVWKPQVSTPNGVRESQLFKDLMELNSNNRADAIDDYSIIKSNWFLDRYTPIIKFDDGEEPILSSVIEKGLLDSGRMVSKLNKQIGAIKDGQRVYLEDNTDNYLELSSKAIKFNQDSTVRDKFIAVVRIDNGRITLSVEPKDADNENLASQIALNYSLNEKIRTILAKSGVSIERLTSLQDTLRSENGVVDYQNATETADGFLALIKLADGSRGEKALPEEFAHLMIDMLSDEPLIKRLLSSVGNLTSKILGDEYDSYVEEYNGDQERLNREAAGKLVYRELIGNKIEAPQYRNFIDRVISSVKNAIKRLFNRDDITNAMYSAELAARGVAKRILSTDDIQKIQKDRISRFTNLSQLNRSAIKAKDVLQKSIDNAVKTASFYIDSLENRIRTAPETSSNKNVKTKKELQAQLDDYKHKMQEFIGKQNVYLDTQMYNLGVENFIESASNDMNSVVKRLESCINDSLTIGERAYILTNVKNILNGVEQTIDDISTSEHYSDSDIELSDLAKQHLDVLSKNAKEARRMLNDQTLITFANYLEKYFKHTINFGDKSISKDNLIDILKTADKDINLLDTWLMSAADSGDIVIKLTDQALKASKERKRRKTLDIVKRLEAAAKKLPSKNTDFMFEKHSDGTLSGRYISSTNWTAFKDAEKEMRDSLDEQYGKIAKGKKAEEKLAKRSKWYIENTNEYGYPSDKYNVDVEKILTPEQYQYYKEFMDIRDELLNLLPPKLYDKDPMRAVQITKDLWERISSTSPSKWAEQFYKSARRSLVTNVDDTGFGLYGKADFSGRQMLSVPIFFINNVEESSLSHDTVSTMSAFADMAINYDEMMNIADFLELGRDVMERRDAQIIKNKETLKEKASAFGVKVTKPLKKDNNNFVTRYNELLKSQLYGRYMNDGTLVEGKTWEIKSNKAATVLNKISSLNQLALNALAGIAAIGNDMINVESEALAGQYFKHKHLAKADGIYLKELPKVLAEMGDPIKTSKLGLFIEKFDVLHEYDNDIKDLNWNKSKIKKLMSSNSLYIFMHMGSHFGETRTALAQALATEITSDDGKEKSTLWDILEPKPIDSKHPEYGYTLEVKDGYTLTGDQITYYTRKFMGFNERLFGAYNLADRSALQATALGQLVFLYRKFMVPAIHRRFSRADFNLDLNTEIEGYYRSTFRFLKDLATDSKDLGRNIKMYLDQMTDNEKANCMRAANELGMVAVLSYVVAILTHADWDKRDNPWHRRFLAYMSRRMKTEAQAFTPFGVWGETWNIVKSPAAAINTLESAGDLLNLLNPLNYFGEDAIVKSGRYKGHTKARKYFMNSPLVPTNKTIYKIIHPEESIVAFR